MALVGASGSGKSSLVNLIPRFYLPTEGRILLDGIDINDLGLTSLRRNIALVSQDILLFNDSIRNNIAYGALRGVGTAEVLQAAQAAHVLEFGSYPTASRRWSARMGCASPAGSASASRSPAPF